MKPVLLVAGVYNIVWGALVVVFPLALFRWLGMAEPNYPQIWQCVGMVVGVYGVAVTPPARGKGIGAAISLKPLLEARDRDGYHHAVLFATEVGVPVYQRIGFRLTGGYINRYLWRNT